MNADRKLLPLPKKSDYLTAMERAKARGLRLASDVLHDEFLLTAEDQPGFGKCYPAWAREILVYGGRGEPFRKREDVVDKETGWVLPASYLTPNVIGRASELKDERLPICLLIDPESIGIEKGRVVVHPSRIEFLWQYPFFPYFSSHSMGVAELSIAGTYNPLMGPPSRKDLNKGTRVYVLLERLSIRPIGRTNDCAEDATTVFGNTHPSAELGVMLEMPDRRRSK